MTTEEFQILVLEKLTGLEQGQKNLELGQKKLESGQNEILSEIKNLKDADQALLDLVEKTYRKTDQIEEKLDHHANMLDVLATRTTHQEAEIKGLKIAK